MLLDLVVANADAYGSRTAVECGDTRLGFDELAEQVARVAGGLAELGVSRGDNVIVVLPNSALYPVCFLAVAALGAGAVLVDPSSTEHELRYAFADCRPSAAIADQRAAGRCRALCATLDLSTAVVSMGSAPSGAVPFERVARETARSPVAGATDDLALYQYSSGSTGRAKRVGRTQGQCVAEARLLASSLGLVPGDTILCAVPLFHAYGFGDCFLAALGSGARLLVQPQVQPFVVRRTQTLELIGHHGVTVFPAVPYMIDLLTGAAGDADFSSVRHLFTAGTGLPVESAAAFAARFGVHPRQLYGCTEAPSVCANLDGEPESTARSVGRPLEGVVVTVRDDGGAVLPEGEAGEVGIRSPASSSGYVGESFGDQRTFRDGWVFPGDIGVIDAHGRLTLQGRTKLFIDVYGHKVDPLEVEDVIVSHPAVTEAVVVGASPGGGRDPVVKAAVVVNASCTERELVHFCRERLALYKVPQIVEFRDAIPRSPLGKVLRKELV